MILKTKRSVCASAAIALLVATATSLQAGNVLEYDNGPINGTITARTINFGWEVSDSFTVTHNTTLTSAQVGLWTSGGTPLSVDWSVGTSPYASDVASGTSSQTSTPTGQFGFGSLPIYESVFSISAAVSTGTTYYLTLQNEGASDANPVYWDENGGPSIAFQMNPGAGIDNGQLANSESFQLYSSTGTVVPEPGSLTLLGLALVSMGGFGWLKRRKA